MEALVLKALGLTVLLRGRADRGIIPILRVYTPKQKCEKLGPVVRRVLYIYICIAFIFCEAPKSVTSSNREGRILLVATSKARGSLLTWVPI